MSTQVRVYDNEHGDPVVVMVTTGTFDVSRLVGLLNSGRYEDHDTAERITRAVRRRNGGPAALRLLAAHGGPALLDPSLCICRPRHRDDDPLCPLATNARETAP